MSTQPKTREQFAEFYVAAQLADAGWNVYLPRWDNGFDFMIERTVVLDGDRLALIRPVQVRGKYLTEDKGDTRQYGVQNGLLTRVHPDMIVAMPFFDASNCHPTRIAYLPWSRISPIWDEEVGKWAFTCFPAGIKAGEVYARQDYQKFFDAAGMKVLAGIVVNLESHGIGETQAAGLRARLGAFVEDWDAPQMDVYDEV